MLTQLLIFNANELSDLYIRPSLALKLWFLICRNCNRDVHNLLNGHFCFSFQEVYSIFALNRRKVI